MRPRHWLYTIPLRVRSLFKKSAVDSELDDELRFHLDQKTQEYISKGYCERDARYTALRKFGGVEQSKEKSRDARKVNLLLDFAQDLRFGARMLRKNPGFSVIAILILALGIGANAAIFSVVNSVVIRPLPYPSPDQIVSISGSSPIEFSIRGTSLQMTWAKWADKTQSFQYLAACENGDLNFAVDGSDPERIAAAEVSDNFFQTLGIAPIAGRTFLPEEEIPNHPAVALISAALCRRIGGPNDVIGKTLTMNGKPTVIVGVMPFGFDFPAKSSVWLPMPWTSGDEILMKQASFFDTIGRLKATASPAQAHEELLAIATDAREAVKKSNPGRKFAPLRAISVVPLHDQLAGSSKSGLMILLGAVGFVLLIACADVANLLLARAVQRRREIAVRTALGASRLRLVRQSLTESILLSSIGGAAGLALAYGSLRALRQFIPPNLLFVQKVNLDGNVLLFLMGVSALCGLIFGLVPAAHALRFDINEPLKDGSGSSLARRSFLGRARGLLAVTEIALALVLLVGAGLLIKSFWRLINVDTGFHSESVLTASITLPPNVYKTAEQREAFFQQSLQNIAAIPGVTAAAYVNNLPFGNSGRVMFKVDLEQETPAHLALQDQLGTFFYSASSNYFHALGIPLLAGREFSDADRAGAPLTVIINKSIAELFWPGENPIGRRIGIPSQGTATAWAEIVGIVANSKHAKLDEKPASEFYTPILQTPAAAMFLVARVSGGPATSINAIRQTVARIDRTLPFSTFVTMNKRVSDSTAEPRFRTLLLGIFAALALILAAAGIYGVMSYSVAQRTREIGIRVAMGARRGDILSLVLGQSLKLTFIGIAIGLGASWGLTRLLASALYNVAPHDFFTLASVSILLAAVALFASYIPARRAMRVDPLVALRYE